MTVRETCVQALRSMRALPLRSFLTTFGIAVGIAAVVVLVALGNGIRTGHEQSLNEFSTTIFVAQVTAGSSGGNGTRVLRDRDADALVGLPDIVSVVPVVQGTSIVTHAGRQFSARVDAAGENYLAVTSYRLGEGRMFTSADDADRSKVVVLGPDVVRYLFDGDRALALRSEVVIGRSTFRVIGTLDATPDADDAVLIPLETARTSIYANNDKLGTIYGQVVSPDRVDGAVERFYDVMDRQHFIREPGVRDYQVYSSVFQLRRTTAFLDLIQLFTLGVAGIALFVGGLGVANIVLVSVTERTREIGLLKAIGARRGAIVRQFLVEATILSGIGGLFGIGLGLVVTLVGGPFVPAYVPDAAPPELSPTSMVVAFAVSVMIGVLAGVYPAFRAASMRPVKALTY